MLLAQALISGIPLNLWVIQTQNIERIVCLDTFAELLLYATTQWRSLKTTLSFYNFIICECICVCSYRCMCMQMFICETMCHICAHMCIKRATWLSFLRYILFLLLFFEPAHWPGAYQVVRAAAREFQGCTGSTPQCWECKSALPSAMLHGFTDLTQLTTYALF